MPVQADDRSLWPGRPWPRTSDLARTPRGDQLAGDAELPGCRRHSLARSSRPIAPSTEGHSARAPGVRRRGRRVLPRAAARPAGPATACPSRSGSGRTGSRRRRRRRAFSVGLIYGPSGGGKSSFVKAGLLPRLARPRPAGLRRGVARRDRGPAARPRSAASSPTCRPTLGLADAAACVRERRAPAARAQGRCSCSTSSSSGSTPTPTSPTPSWSGRCASATAAALQALLLVRDDFWMAVTRFLQALEVPLVEGGNSAAVELFDAGTRAQVLAEFGRAFGQLPEPGGDRDRRRPVPRPGRPRAGRARRPRHPRPPEPLRRDGPAPPVDARDSPRPRRRRGDRRDVPGGDLRLDAGPAVPPAPPRGGAGGPPGAAARPDVRSSAARPAPAAELPEAAGYADRPDEFAELMRILDQRAAAGHSRRPGRADGPTPTSGSALARPRRRYQLAHDFLVRPIRQWLEREQGATRGPGAAPAGWITASWPSGPRRGGCPRCWSGLGILLARAPSNGRPTSGG